jgi:hypothetical protein
MSPNLRMAALRRISLAAAAEIAALTPRQRDVLQGMLAGLLNKQIAFHLGITEKTVKMHRAQLMLRLRTRTTAAAIRIAVEATFAPFFDGELAPPPLALG